MDASDVAGRLVLIGAVVVILSGIGILTGNAERLTFIMGSVGLLLLAAGAYVSRRGLPGGRA